DHKRPLTARTIIEPNAVRRLHFPRLLAKAAPGANPFGILVILVNVAGAIAVGDVKPAVGSKGDIGRAVLLLLLVHARFLGIAHLPNHFALEVGLDHSAMVDVGQVEELIAALFADVDAVAAGVVLFAPRADELAVFIKDDDAIDGILGLARPLLLDVD